ncbi:hypothetical protein GGR35_001605 [Mucilaginibacter phyllosphaerae]|uniref:Uncharacterized protein n=1 Tax=Mucilaginibacter phyllosphaerae TaxID=1812349 RepID=A0ABR6I7I8_9SPHI|nr:hypothetical protein [Mucilaginibacter phyllosphaerae]
MMLSPDSNKGYKTPKNARQSPQTIVIKKAG